MKKFLLPLAALIASFVVLPLHAQMQPPPQAAGEAVIQGEVRVPGHYALPQNSSLSVVQLISLAGGLTSIAEGHTVVVTRAVAGQVEQLHVDVLRELKHSARVQKTLVQPGDSVYVPARLKR